MTRQARLPIYLLGIALLLAGVWLLDRVADLSVRPGLQVASSTPSSEPPTPSVLAPPGAELAFADGFSGGSPQLPWEPFPFFNLDNLRGGLDPTSPTGEAGVGVLSNENVGGFAALSYVAREVPGDFYLEAWVYLTVTEDETGPLNGLSFRIDPEGERFYRLASHFTSDRELTLAYVGRDTNNFPVYLGRWKGEDLPGGAPTDSAWHRLGIEVVDDRAEVYWDGVRLPGGPFAVDRVPSGFVGVYANFVGGLGHAETRVDDLKTWRVRPD